MKVLSALCLLGLLASACSAQTSDPVGVTESTTLTAPLSTTVASLPVEGSATTASSTTSSVVPDEEPSVALGVIEFIEVLDELLAETSYADAIVEDPEVFLATGMLLCERLDDGANPSDLLSEYIGTLVDGDIDGASSEILDLSGWLLGTSVGYLCPQHTDTLEGLNE